MNRPMKLHHIGYVTEEIDSVARKYVARFGYEFATPVIHDPAQTAKVQFLKLSSDEAYLELVSPDGPGSKLVGATKRRAPLNHLCYITNSLDATISHLEQEGMRLISELSQGVAFAGRRICWLLGDDMLPIELVEQLADGDPCTPGISSPESFSGSTTAVVVSEV